MSYDLKVAVKVEGCGEYADIAEPEYANPTYNLRDMFVACMNWDYKQGEYYRCDKVISKIEHGIKELRENRGAYEKYIPDGLLLGDQISDAVDALESLKVCICDQAEEIPLKCLYMRW